MYYLVILGIILQLFYIPCNLLFSQSFGCYPVILGVFAQFRKLSRTLPGRTDERTKPSADVVAEIRTEYSRIQFLSDAIYKTILNVVI